MKIYNTASEAYLETLKDVYFNPDVKSSPRGLPVREKLDYTFRILSPDSSPLVTRDPERNVVIASYTDKEVLLYNSCTNSAADFGKASKFWLSLANPDGTVNSAYGYLIWKNKSHGNPDFEVGTFSNDFGSNLETELQKRSDSLRTPWEYAKKCLLSDKDTRQAIMRFSLPQHAWIGNKDQVCTLHGNWLIRDNQLHLSVVMRSNDLMLGLVFDLPWFCSLMDRMLMELKSTYPDLKKGFYTHMVHSIHIYERDEVKIRRMLGL
jgi:thymidylate synthase